MSHLNDESFFPKEVKFPKIKANSTQRYFSEIHNGLLLLKKNSKNELGKGYQVHWVERNDRKIGSNLFPQTISIDSLEDYFFLAGNIAQRNFERFCQAVQIIRKELPMLEEWLGNHVNSIEPNLENWQDILAACRYFLETPQPNLYIRELPLPIHTKFIENHKVLIDSLLLFLLPPTSINKQFVGFKNSQFEKRYGLKFSEHLVRFRYLNPAEAISPALVDCAIPLSRFLLLNPATTRVIITENKMNFLTLPKISNTLAIFGTGYGVTGLKNIEWLQKQEIYYWGDLDVNGFAILSNLRKHFPNAISVMMDWGTFNQFKTYQVHDPKTRLPTAERLTPEEQSVFEYLCEHSQNDSVKNRLEQEHISQEWVLKAFFSLL